jgi:DNA-binding beta-propeller fold protein YncE
MVVPIKLAIATSFTGCDFVVAAAVVTSVQHPADRRLETKGLRAGSKLVGLQVQNLALNRKSCSLRHCACRFELSDAIIPGRAFVYAGERVSKEQRMTRPVGFQTLPAAILLSATALIVADAQSKPPQPAKALDGVPFFEADPKWPVLPADWKWGQVIGIFADAEGHVWTSSSSRISEWDPQGKLVQSWEARGPNKDWRTIHGMFVDHNGFVWSNARESNLTVKYTKKGDVTLVIGKQDQTGGSNDTSLMGRPSEIWVDPADNEVFVADGYGNRRVIVFDGASGRYLRHWGAYGKRPEDPVRTNNGGRGATGAGQDAPRQTDTVPAAPPQQFSVPHGITGSRDGLIYVADRANNRIQVFRQNGEYVAEKILRVRCGAQEKATWAPKRACGTEAAFSLGFSHDVPQTYMYVADGGSHVITVLRRKDLEVVSEFGGPGVGPGQLGRPHNLTVDPWGNIYVAEAAGPTVKHPATGAEIEAGYRAQKFTFKGTRPAR